MDMDKIEHRATMMFHSKEHVNDKLLFGRMIDIYGTSVLQYPAVLKWSITFQHGRDTLEDDPGSGTP